MQFSIRLFYRQGRGASASSGDDLVLAEPGLVSLLGVSEKDNAVEESATYQDHSAHHVHGGYRTC